MISLVVAALLGSIGGVAVAICVVSAFAAMILSSIFNVYYAVIFFLVGSFYFYKIIKKSQIQLQMDSDYTPRPDNREAKQASRRDVPDPEEATLLKQPPKEMFKRPLLVTET